MYTLIEKRIVFSKWQFSCWMYCLNFLTYGHQIYKCQNGLLLVSVRRSFIRCPMCTTAKALLCKGFFKVGFLKFVFLLLDITIELMLYTFSTKLTLQSSLVNNNQYGNWKVTTLQKLDRSEVSTRKPQQMCGLSTTWSLNLTFVVNR